MASKSLGTLTLDLIAKIGGYTGPLDKAERKTKESTSNMAKYAKTAAKALASIGVVGGFAALIKSSADAADQLSKSSKTVGIAIEDLSGLKHAADLSGVSFEQLQVGLVKFSKSTSDALKGTGEGAAAYKQLGISITDTNGNLKSNYELLNEVADAFTGMQDGAQKTAIAQNLLGDSGAKLIPLLNGGASGIKDFRQEAERLGLVIDQKTGSASENFNDNMSRLRETMVGFGNAIASEIVPELADFTSAIADPEVQKNIAQFTGGLISSGKALLEFLSSANKFISDVSKEIAARQTGYRDDVDTLTKKIESLQFARDKAGWYRELLLGDKELAGNVELIDMEIAKTQELVEERKKAEAAKAAISSSNIPQQNISQPKKQFTETNNASIEADINGQLEERIKLQRELYAQADKLNELVMGQQDGYRRQLMLSSDATEAQRLQYEVAYGSLKGITAEQEKMLEGMAQELDARNSLAESEKKHQEIVAALGKAHEESLQAAGNMVDLENYRAQKRRDELAAELDELRSKGQLTAEIEADANKLLEEQEQAHQDRLAAIKKQADEDEIKRRQAQLAGAEQLFSSLGDLTEAFGNRASRARKVLLIAEKAASIARASMAISTGIAEAAANPWPLNLGAMASVAAATAGIIGDIQAVNIAHGGMDYVPKETTYLLDKGERVVSPNQNRDLTNFLSNAKSGTGVPNIQIINQTGVAANAEASMLNDGTMQVILRAVDNKLMGDLGRGGGVWGEARKRYGWSVKGAF